MAVRSSPTTETQKRIYPADRPTLGPALRRIPAASRRIPALHIFAMHQDLDRMDWPQFSIQNCGAITASYRILLSRNVCLMAVKATCPNCQRAFNLADRLAGKQVKCTSCQFTFRVATTGSGAEISAPEIPVAASLPTQRPHTDSAWSSHSTTPPQSTYSSSYSQPVAPKPTGGKRPAQKLIPANSRAGLDNSSSKTPLITAIAGVVVPVLCVIAN